MVFEKDFKGGVDQDSKEEVVRNSEWKYATMWHFYNFVELKCQEKNLKQKFGRLRGTTI